MEKVIYFIRHCEAEGQPIESPLTERGLIQAEDLSGFFADKTIDRIISSPFLRAIQSVTPLSERTGIDIESDERLSERVLSSESLPDWLEKLEETFTNMELVFEGGESSRQATERAVNVIKGILTGESHHTVVVTHGNLLSLILKHYDNSVGFEDWKRLTNPDVFRMTWKDGYISMNRIWK